MSSGLEDRQHVPSIVLELERRVEVLEEHALNERIEALERWRDRMIASNR
jgi:hypothetical protein